MKTPLFLSTLLLLALYKTWVIGFGRPVALISSYEVEALLWGVLWLLSMRIERSRSRVARHVASLLFYPLWVVSFISIFVHTYFFDSAAERRFSLLDVNLSQVGFFFASVLPLAGWLTLVGMLTALALSTWLLFRKLEARTLRWPTRLLLLQACLVALLVRYVPHIPSPIVDLVADVHERLVHPSIVVDAQVEPAGPLSALDKSAAAPHALSTPFKKIVIIVMETMNERTLREQTAKLKAETFLRQASSHAHVYGRYYTSNQDSRTGMLGMLSSRFVPYEAYTEEGRDHYLHLSSESSLPQLFHRLGYQTAFAVSQTDLELVVAELPWQEKLVLSQAEVTSAKASFLCFNPYEFEHSCEDKVLLPKVVKFLSDHDHAFVYQEMIWGHASEYNEASGKSNAQYYSEYIDALLSALSTGGLLDDTLLVVTADHGFRDKAMQLEPSIYQVPLFFYAARFSPDQQAGLYSHLDFKDLLLHELVPDSKAVQDNPFVFVVGPTGTSIRSVITRDHGFLAFKERASDRILLRQRNPSPQSSNGVRNLEPTRYLKLYDSYRAAFERAGAAR